MRRRGSRCRSNGAAIGWKFRRREPNGPVTSAAFDAGFYAESSADTPDLLEIALDKPDYKPGETMNVAVTARTAGQVTLNVFTDKLRDNGQRKT